MRVGIMQPYFFPYAGYFSLIKHTDKWVMFDCVQFIRHGWIERNRILKPGQDWQYISVPLKKHDRTTLIKDIKIRTEEDWKSKILRQLEHYRKQAPYYVQTIELIQKALNIETDSITLLNKHILATICDYLSIHIDVSVFSEMDLSIEPVTHAGEWALNISKALGATEYVNPPGGIEIFVPEQFNAAGVKLSFLKNNLPAYSQRRPQFENGLSIIDVLMFNDAGSTNKIIDDITFIQPE